MPILTGREILQQMQELHTDGKPNIVIEPFNPERLGPNSYDVHLGDKLLIYKNSPIDPKIDNETVEFPMTNHPKTGERCWIIQPNKLYLGRTLEYTKTRCFVPMLEGRSSIGRLGIDIHKTAGVGDNGFDGTWTLEITATEVIILYPGMKIGQLIYHTLQGEQTFYCGRYKGQIDPIATRFHLGEKKEFNAK